MEKFKQILKNPKTEFAIVTLIMMVAVFIRSYHFGIIPVGIHQDEAMAAVDAKALADYGTDRFGMRYPLHFTAWGGAQMSVLLSYCMVPFIKIFGFSIVPIRLPMLIVSSIGLLALYFFVRQIAGGKTAVIALLLGTICPWHYMQSRWSFDCNMFPHFFLIAACFLLAGLKRHWMLYLSMIFFGLCSYCYGIANYSVPLFLLIVAIYLLKRKNISWKEMLIYIVVYLVVALPEFIIMFINMFKLHTIETPIFTLPYFPRSFRAKDILLTNFSWEQLWKNIVCCISTVWGNGDKSVTNTIVKFGPVYYVTTVFFAVGLAVVIVKVKKAVNGAIKASYFVLLMWLAMGLWVGVVTREVTINRINIIFYPILVTAAIGIAWCISKWRLLAAPIAVAYGILGIQFAVTYFGNWGDISRTYYYEPYINALNYAKNISCDYYYITPDPQGEGVNEVGEILAMYCHEIDAHYYQGISNVQDGREQLPYSEKYHYEDVTPEIVEENDGKAAVYIVRPEAVTLFPADKYDINSFYDKYFVITEKRN